MGQSFPGTSTSNTKKNNMHTTTVHRVCWIHPEKNYLPDFFFFFKMAYDKVFRKCCKCGKRLKKAKKTYILTTFHVKIEGDSPFDCKELRGRRKILKWVFNFLCLVSSLKSVEVMLWGRGYSVLSKQARRKQQPQCEILGLSKQPKKCQVVQQGGNCEFFWLK